VNLELHTKPNTNIIKIVCFQGDIHEENRFCPLTKLTWDSSRIGGVVVSVLATGLKDCGFEPGQGDGFLRAIKIRSTPSSRMGSKAGRSHVVRLYGM
jgi:hypothetical protein